MALTEEYGFSLQSVVSGRDVIHERRGSCSLASAVIVTRHVVTLQETSLCPEPQRPKPEILQPGNLKPYIPEHP